MLLARNPGRRAIQTRANGRQDRTGLDSPRPARPFNLPSLEGARHGGGLPRELSGGHGRDDKLGGRRRRCCRRGRGSASRFGGDSGLEDQSGDATTLTVSNATITGTDGWVAVHRDDGNGRPQVPQSIGQAPLSEGENTNVVFMLDEPISSFQTLHAMIHSDDPTDETYTFPNGDPPVQVNGGAVVEPLRYAAGGERATRGKTDGEPLPKSGGLDVLVCRV
jgi:hypothetical protein